MSRLLAVSSRRAPSPALLEKFKSLAFEGQTPTLGPDARGHNDGWGLAGFLGGRLIQEKSPLSATDPQGGWDDAVKRLLVPAMWPGHCLFHLRRAAPGMDVRVANSHPYHRKHFGKDWFFMGHVEIAEFDPDNHDGMTDTEYFMNEVLSQLPEGGDLKEAIDAAKAAISGKYTGLPSLTGVFMTPMKLEACYDVADKFDRYHTLFKAETDGSVIICSEKMPLDGVEWKPYRDMDAVLTVKSFRKP